MIDELITWVVEAGNPNREAEIIRKAVVALAAKPSAWSMIVMRSARVSVTLRPAMRLPKVIPPATIAKSKPTGTKDQLFSPVK
jgi:hypothetical protein